MQFCFEKVEEGRGTALREKKQGGDEILFGISERAAGPGNYFRLVNAIPLKARAVYRRIGARASALRRRRSEVGG